MHPWRARLDRWFGPLASRCPFSPNQLTVAGMLLNILAAVILSVSSARPVLFLVAPGVVTVAGLLDAFDGIVARHKHLESRFGDFLDHLCDRVSDLALLAGWILGARVRPEIGLPAMIVVMLNGYIGTQIEATWGERTYEGPGRGEYVLAVVILPLLAFSLASADILEQRFAGLSVPEWLTLTLAVAALLAVVSRLRLARRIGREEGRNR